MQDASRSSPLALPENAWGGRRWYGPDLSANTGRAVLALLLSLYGAILVVSGLLSLGFAWGPGDGSVAVDRIHFPWMLATVGTAEGLIWIGLGAAVLREFPSMARRSVALLLLLRGTRHVVWLMSPSTFSNPWWVSLILALSWLGLGLGVWRAGEWARRGCMAFGLGFYGYELAVMTWSMRQFGGWMSSHPFIFARAAIIGATVVALPPMALAIYGVLRSTQEHFAETRGARARAVPG